jgi:hypothetical protein
VPVEVVDTHHSRLAKAVKTRHPEFRNAAEHDPNESWLVLLNSLPARVIEFGFTRLFTEYYQCNNCAYDTKRSPKEVHEYEPVSAPLPSDNNECEALQMMLDRTFTRVDDQEGFACPNADAPCCAVRRTVCVDVFLRGAPSFTVVCISFVFSRAGEVRQTYERAAQSLAGSHARVLYDDAGTATKSTNAESSSLGCAYPTRRACELHRWRSVPV